MHLVEIFLPLFDSIGDRFMRVDYQVIENELTERYGGITAYPRTPASGLWKDSEDETQNDQLVVYEVLLKEVDTVWWHEYRRKLELVFRQEKILVRVHEVEIL
jgi:hypothetical protein